MREPWWSVRSKPKKKKRKDPRAKIEVRVHTGDGEMLFEGYMDTLELSRDFLETTTSDVMRTYVGGEAAVQVDRDRGAVEG